MREKRHVQLQKERRRAARTNVSNAYMDSLRWISAGDGRSRIRRDAGKATPEHEEAARFPEQIERAA